MQRPSLMRAPSAAYRATDDAADHHFGGPPDGGDAAGPTERGPPLLKLKTLKSHLAALCGSGVYHVAFSDRVLLQKIRALSAVDGSGGGGGEAGSSPAAAAAAAGGGGHQLSAHVRSLLDQVVRADVSAASESDGMREALQLESGRPNPAVLDQTLERILKEEKDLILHRSLSQLPLISDAIRTRLKPGRKSGAGRVKGKGKGKGGGGRGRKNSRKKKKSEEPAPEDFTIGRELIKLLQTGLREGGDGSAHTLLVAAKALLCLHRDDDDSSSSSSSSSAGSGGKGKREGEGEGEGAAAASSPPVRLPNSRLLHCLSRRHIPDVERIRKLLQVELDIDKAKNMVDGLRLENLHSYSQIQTQVQAHGQPAGIIMCTGSGAVGRVRFDRSGLWCV
jgi:hypothetical protein